MSEMIERSVKRWEKKIAKELVGKKIKAVRYLTDEEVGELGWSSKALVITLSNGQLLWLSCDDEGNEAGAMHTSIESLPVIPVIG